MKFKTSPCLRLAAAATLLGLAAGAQAAIVISLTPTQQADLSWDTLVNVSGSVAANAAMALGSPNFEPYIGSWTALTLSGTTQVGLLHGYSAPSNVDYDYYQLASGSTFVNSLGAPAGFEIAGAPGGEFGVFYGSGISLDYPSKNLFLSENYGLGSTVSYSYTAGDDITSWAVAGAYASLKDANGLELFRIQVNASNAYSATAVTAVPEPGTYALMALGLGALGFVARRRRRG